MNARKQVSEQVGVRHPLSSDPEGRCMDLQWTLEEAVEHAAQLADPRDGSGWKSKGHDIEVVIEDDDGNHPLAYISLPQLRCYTHTAVGTVGELIGHVERLAAALRQHQAAMIESVRQIDEERRKRGAA